MLDAALEHGPPGPRSGQRAHSCGSLGTMAAGIQIGSGTPHADAAARNSVSRDASGRPSRIASSR